MFNNTLMADIYFLVGQADSARRFPAHKYILATGSTVFYAMLYGGLADDKVMSMFCWYLVNNNLFQYFVFPRPKRSLFPTWTPMHSWLY